MIANQDLTGAIRRSAMRRCEAGLSLLATLGDPRTIPSETAPNCQTSNGWVFSLLTGPNFLKHQNLHRTSLLRARRLFHAEACALANPSWRKQGGQARLSLGVSWNSKRNRSRLGSWGKHGIFAGRAAKRLFP